MQLFGRLVVLEILGARKERPKYLEQPVTGVPKVIEHILRFGKGNHLPRDEESVITGQTLNFWQNI